jgi:hypothetical protein
VPSGPAATCKKVGVVTGVRAAWPSAQARRHAAPALSGHSANDVVDSRRVIIIGPVVSVWVKGFEATDTAFRNSCRYLTQIAARYPCFKVSRRSARLTRMMVALLTFISRATALIDAPSATLCSAFCRCSPSSTGLRPKRFPSALARACPDNVRSISKSRSNCATAEMTPMVILPAGLVRSTPPSVRGPANSPPEAGSIRHPRPVETATPGRRHRAVRRGKLPLTNNFIW